MRLVYPLCLLVVGWLFAMPIAGTSQCTTPSSSLTSNKSGEWGQCGTGSSAIVWTDGVSVLSGIYNCSGSAPLWSSTGGTSGLMSNRSHVINNGHTITVSVSANSAWHYTRGLHVMAGGTLTISQPIMPGNSTYTGVTICGTLNFNNGTTDFNTMNLTVRNGGVLNINGGTFEVNTITVENGGTINLNGGTLVRNGQLTVNAGGVINITNGASRLRYDGFGVPNTVLDGTINCNAVLTNLNYTNIHLGNTRVTNGTSTGRIRTASPYVPHSEISISSSNNFFGFNADYGGTVEYYGGSSITLASTHSRWHYYDLEVNITGAGNGLLLGSNSCTNVVGNLHLKSGNLKMNGKVLKLHGRIQYVGSNFLEGTPSSSLYILGKLSSSIDGCDDLSSGLTTYNISSQGSTVDVRQFELRMSAVAGSAASLQYLKIFREDIVHLRSNLTVTTLDIPVGILRTYAPSIINVTGTAAANLNDNHRTTGWSNTGYVSGHLRRVLAASTAFDFPVGYPNATNYATDRVKHRRLTLSVNTLSGSGALTVCFVPPTPDCNGLLNPLTENGMNFLRIHPEGHWNMEPDPTLTSANYGARLYIHGFASPVLVNNLFSPLKRVTNSGCVGWGIPAGSSIPPANTSGRISELSGPQEVGHSARNNITGFSDIAIGIMDAPLPVALLAFSAQPNGLVVDTQWETQQERSTASFALERADATGHYETLAVTPARGSDNGWQYATQDREPLFGVSYYRLRINDMDGSFAYGPVVEVRREATLPLLSLLPNPTAQASELVVAVEQPCELSLRLLDVAGQVRHQQAGIGLAPGTHRIALSRDRIGLGAGVYMLEVKLAGATQVLKWVVR